MTTNEPRTFSEQEHLAILADRVANETASLKATVEALSKEKADMEALVAEKAELAAKLDVAEAARVALESEKAAAVKEFEDFKAGLEAEKAALAKKDERLVAAKAAADHLPAEFFADETRVARIVAMSDEVFEGYVADLAATNTGTKAPEKKENLKETAMAGKQVEAPKADADAPRTAALGFLLPHLVTEGGN
jgi:chromosome segregation ATPase